MIITTENKIIEKNLPKNFVVRFKTFFQLFKKLRIVGMKRLLLRVEMLKDEYENLFGSNLSSWCALSDWYDKSKNDVND